MSGRRTDANESLVRIRDLAGRPRGTGFPVDDRSTLITSHEAVDGLACLVLHAPGDRTVVVGADAITPLPECDLALVRAEGLAMPPLPVAAAPRVDGGTRVRLKAGRWHRAEVVGDALVTYTATDRFHLLGAALELSIGERTTLRLGDEATGGPVLDARTGAVLAVLGTALQADHEAAGFAIPLRATAAARPGGALAELLERNAAAVPAYGPDLNLAGALELTATSLGSVATPRAWQDPVRRPEIEREFGHFLDAGQRGTARVLGLVGEPGTGRTTELGALAARRARGAEPAPTLWLRGADLRADDRSLRDAVARALKSAGRIVTASAGATGTVGDACCATPEAVAELAHGVGRPLLVLLDGPEEMPPVLAHALPAWTEATARWLEQTSARLVIACRPEHWESAGRLFPAGLLHAPRATLRAAAEREPVGPAMPPCVRLGDLTPDQAALARSGHAIPDGAIDPADACHPLALRLLAEVRAALPAGAITGPMRAVPDRWDVFSAYLDLACLRIAVRLAAARRPPLRGTAVRRLAARVAGQVHEAARRCLGPGQGELEREAFEELFPWRTGWASAVLTEGLLVPAGAGYRFAHEEFADWLHGTHLDLDAALHALVHRWHEPDGPPAEALLRLPSRRGGSAPAPDGHVPPPPGSRPMRAGRRRGRRTDPEPAPAPRPLPVPRHRIGPVLQALIMLARRSGPDQLSRRLAALVHAVEILVPQAGTAGAAGTAGVTGMTGSGAAGAVSAVGMTGTGASRVAGAAGAGGTAGRGEAARNGADAPTGEGGPMRVDGRPMECGGDGPMGADGGPMGGEGGPAEADSGTAEGARSASGARSTRRTRTKGARPKDARTADDARAGEARSAEDVRNTQDARTTEHARPKGRPEEAPTEGTTTAAPNFGDPHLRDPHPDDPHSEQDTSTAGDGAPGHLPDPAWWAARLLAETLLRLPDATPYRRVLRLLAERLTACSRLVGGFDSGAVATLGGLTLFGPSFWLRLRLGPADRLDLLRRLVPADAPPRGATAAPGDRFLPTVATLLTEDPGTVQPLLCRWFGDERPLLTGPEQDPGQDPDLPPPTVAAAAQALLHTHRGQALDDLTEALVRTAHPRADELLAALAEDEPSALCRAVDRWAHDEERLELHVAAAAYGLKAAPHARTDADRELLRYAARALLSRPGEDTLHGAALTLLVRDRETRARHLPQALARFAAGDPQLPPDALAAALTSHPEPVLAAFRARLHEVGDGPAAVLATLARVSTPALARRASALVREYLEHHPDGAGHAAAFVDRRLEEGSGARAVLFPLVADLLRTCPAQVRRALAPVLAAPGTPASRPLRQELLEVLLEREQQSPDQDQVMVLDALLRAVAEGAPGRGEARTKDLLLRTAELLARSTEGTRCLDRRLAQLAREVPVFGALLRRWLRSAPAQWARYIGPRSRIRLSPGADDPETGQCQVPEPADGAEQAGPEPGATPADADRRQPAWHS